MALEDLEGLEKMEFPVFSCLCELCDCGEHKHHQNCHKNKLAGITDHLLSHYQSTFTQPLIISQKEHSRVVKEPDLVKPAHSNATIQKCSRSSCLHSSCSGSNHSSKKGSLPSTPPATAGVHDLKTIYGLTYQPLPIKKQHSPGKKRAKPKSAPIESVSTYRQDYPLYAAQALRRRQPITQVDNLHINQHLPVDFNTIQRDSYIGWDAVKYPRRDPIILKNQLRLEGTIDTNTVTRLTYTGVPFNQPQDLNRPMTMQSACGGKFRSGTAYTNSFRPWETESRVRHGDLHDGAYIPPPSSPSAHVPVTSLPASPASQRHEDLKTHICCYTMTPQQEPLCSQHYDMEISSIEAALDPPRPIETKNKNYKEQNAFGVITGCVIEHPFSCLTALRGDPHLQLLCLGQHVTTLPDNIEECLFGIDFVDDCWSCLAALDADKTGGVTVLADIQLIFYKFGLEILYMQRLAALQ
ncbi:uncharacterized protein LOC125466990 isoform X2 [Stegostoma tigrinum]|uniref:uncharacterized protein LOC125466990 isoform X2 n=1 Tax=Stegostoma tigrinum TaxID=3053191 RepID=UPI0028700607|nr:uncharacterized protein LOC125466990 isoform X2 [Stegostoma tigrinum]